MGRTPNGSTQSGLCTGREVGCTLAKVNIAIAGRCKPIDSPHCIVQLASLKLSCCDTLCRGISALLGNHTE